MWFGGGVGKAHPGGLPSLDILASRAYQAIMKELLRSTDPTVIAFASALLSGEGIEVFELDVHMSVLEGSIGVLPRRMMVRDDDLIAAERVLRDNEIPFERR